MDGTPDIAAHNYIATPPRELACNMGSHSVTCHPAEVTFPFRPYPSQSVEHRTKGIQLRNT